MSMKRYLKWRYVVPAVIIATPVAIALFIAVGGGVVMLLWNWLAPPLFGWKEITIWQGFGLLALCRILFGGFGGGGGNRHRRPKEMSPEEWERFRQRARARFCRPAPDSPEPSTDTNVESSG